MSSKGSLNQRFQDFGATPNANTWQSISSTLAKKKKKKVMLWWTFGSSGIAAIFILGFLLYSPNTYKDKSFAKASDKNPITSKKVEPKNNSNFGDIHADKNREFKIEDKITTDLNHLEKSPENDLGQNISSTKKEINHKGNHVTKQVDKVTLDSFTLVQKDSILRPSNVASKNPENALTSLTIAPIPAQKTHLLSVVHPKIILHKIKNQELGRSQWSWGLELASGRAINRNNYDFSAYGLTDNGNESLLSLQSEQIYFTQVHQPIAIAFHAQYTINKYLYVNASPQLSLLNGVSAIQSYSENLNQHFVSVRTQLNLGCFVVQKNNWKIDLEAGLNFEKMLQTYSFNQESVPLHFWGSQIGMGINYYLKANRHLRFGTTYSWRMGDAEETLKKQFQTLKNIQFGISLIQQF